MKRLPAFARHAGGRGLVHASAFQNRDGKLGVRVSFPAGSGRETTVELPISAARDTLTAMGLALTDARTALDLICEARPPGVGTDCPGEMRMRASHALRAHRPSRRGRYNPGAGFGEATARPAAGQGLPPAALGPSLQPVGGAGRAGGLRAFFEFRNSGLHLHIGGSS